MNGGKEGKGKFFFKYGDIYDGNWKKNKRSGKGKLIYKNGALFEGN